MRTSLLVLAAIAMLAAGEDALGPGRHRGMPCAGGDWTIDILVPATYRPESPVPCLWISSPVGNPGTDDLQDWAERECVAIVSINASRNGMPWTEIERIQDAALRTARARVQLHPHLNLAEGVSGGASASVRLAERNADAFCGVLLQCMSGMPAPQHMAIAWIHGAKDDVIGVGGTWMSYERAQAAKRPCSIVVNRSRKHTPGSKDEKERAVDLILWAGRLTHPKLGRDELKRHHQALDAAMQAAAAIPDPGQRRARCQFLGGLPNADKAPSFPALVAAWGAARLAEVDAETDPGRKLYLLGELAPHAWAARLPADAKADAKKRSDPLRADAAAVASARIEQTYWTLWREEQRAGLDRAKIAELQRKFATLAADAPEHPRGKAAAGDAKRLEKHLGGG